MPRVNLLPPEIAEKAGQRRAKVAMAATGLAAVAVVGVLYAHQSSQVSSAEQAKTRAAARSVQLRTQLNSLQSVQDLQTRVDAAQVTLASAMSSEVLWSNYLHDMTLTIPGNVWLTNFNATVTGATAAPAGGTILDPGIGTVTITGSALGHDDVAVWLESLAKQKGYANPYFTSSVERLIGTRTVVDYASTVNLTPAALSGRYSKGLAR
ncbi:MAG: type pilus assembly protein PilN [Frankiaceae bacterium]|jgi:Tfp pilus assembly protein PilN|nr:type pilus assembly protein PilN [Frankiaceae bacterium]